MDLIVSISSMSIPILTNWAAVTCTYDILSVVVLDILVMCIIDRLTKQMRNGLRFRGYIELESFRSFPTISVLILTTGFTAFFIGMHSSAGKYRCTTFTLLLPQFGSLAWEIIYIAVASFLLVYLLPKTESIFSNNLLRYTDSITVSVLAGVLQASKSIWMIDATYSLCNGNLTWICLLWSATIVMCMYVQHYDYERALWLRYCLCLLINIGIVMMYLHVAAVGHAVDKYHLKNVWNALF